MHRRPQQQPKTMNWPYPARQPCPRHRPSVRAIGLGKLNVIQARGEAFYCQPSGASNRLKNVGAFDRLYPDMVPLPPRSRIGATTLNATGYVHGEGADCRFNFHPVAASFL